ncbi:MAG: hypothetical protein GC154_14215 [bacterium]|nr:hypothetical protein [bacterium]
MSAEWKPTVEAVFCRILQPFAFAFGERVEAPMFPPPPPACLAGSIGFRGDRQGRLRLMISEALALGMAASILGTDLDDDETHKFKQAALMELLNVTGGHVLTDLYGAARVDLGLPECEDCDHLLWSRAASDEASMLFLVDDEPVVLQFCEDAAA